MRKFLVLFLCSIVFSVGHAQINSFSDFKSYIAELNSALPQYNPDGTILASMVVAENKSTWAIFYEIDKPDWYQMKSAGEKKLLKKSQKIVKNQIKSNSEWRSLVEASVRYNYALEYVFVQKEVGAKRAYVYNNDTEICIRYEPNELKKLLK